MLGVPGNISNRKARKRYDAFSKLRIKTAEGRRSGVFILNFVLLTR